MIFLGHACHLVEVGGLRVLTDPWLLDPIFSGHVERDPPPPIGVADLPPIDVIVLSHGHLDQVAGVPQERHPHEVRALPGRRWNVEVERRKRNPSLA